MKVINTFGNVRCWNPVCIVLLITLSSFVHVGVAVQTDNLSDLVDRHVEPVIRAELTPGLVVAIHQDGQTRFFGYGSTHVDRKKLPDSKTIYETGSIGKVFTALMLAEAIRRDEVTLDMPLVELVPENVAPPRHKGQSILLRHLVSHTSGLPREPDNLEPVKKGDPYQGYSKAKLWEFLEHHQLEREPGSQYEYSNLGAGLLSTLLEQRVGETYQQQLVRRIAKPLQLADTTLVLSASQESRLAQATSSGIPVDNWGTEDALKGAGAIRSTPADMIRFAVSQFDLPHHSLAESIELTHSTLHTKADGEKIAFGWHVVPDGDIFWHNGSTGGYHSYLAFHPSERWAIVLLSNTNAYEISLVGDRLTRSLAGEEVSAIEVREAIDIDPQSLQRLVGTYLSPEGWEIEMTRHDDKLLAKIEGQIALRIYPDSPTRFFYREVDAELEFELEKDGNASAVTILQAGNQIRCMRKDTPDR